MKWLKQRSMTMTSKLIIAMILFLLVPVSIMQIALNRQYRRELDQEVQFNLTQSFERTYDSFGERNTDLMTATNFIISNRSVRAITERPYEGVDREFFAEMELCDHVFSEAQYIVKSSQAIFLMALWDGRVFGTEGTLPAAGTILNADWYRPHSGSLRPTWLSMDMAALGMGSGGGGGAFVLLRPMEAGVLLAVFPQRVFAAWLELDGQHETRMYLVGDADGALLYTSGYEQSEPLDSLLPQAMAGWDRQETRLHSEKGYYMVSRGLPMEGWTYAQVVDESRLYRSIAFTRNSFTLLLLVSFLMLSLVVVIISYQVTRSLKAVTQAVRAFGEGNLNTRIPAGGTAETRELSAHFNRMVERINRLIAERKEEEREKTRLHYEALLAQIQPHFLFNAMNSIKWTASLCGAHNVVELITSLGALLEMSTLRVEEMIPLSREIDCVRHYMNLQYARYGEKVATHYRISRQAQEALVPKFILQPLVENALKHGFDQLQLPGDIFIWDTIEGEDLCLYVRNNGNPMDTEAIRALQEPLSAHPAKQPWGMGIGVASVRQRLAFLFGQGYGLTYPETEGETVALLRIPLRYSLEEPHV